jgi:DNA modification methylase
MPFEIHHGDCLEVLRSMPENSIDAIVTDPPYGLTAKKKGGTGTASVNLDSPYGRARIGTGNGPGGFMGLAWDSDVPAVEVWAECLRVLKPGGYLLAFAGTRTQHRMAVRIEDAGFEIRDMIAWVYASGFPKSLDVSKAIDGHRGIVGSADAGPSVKRDTPATKQGEQWRGWGTALKPALEPITMARKPLAGTVAENVLVHGTGALNIDGCRVGDEVRVAAFTSLAPCHGNALGAAGTAEARRGTQGDPKTYVGRWPANLIHDGSDEVLAAFPQAPGQMAKAAEGSDRRKDQNTYGAEPRATGSAARFFYCAKASRADRNDGLEDPGPQFKKGSTLRNAENLNAAGSRKGNDHPTVKPTDLMRYLCRLVTPPGGVVLDPFMGSGSTGRGAVLEGFRFVGIEREEEYVAIARARIEHLERTLAQPEPPVTMDLFSWEAA